MAEPGVVLTPYIALAVDGLCASVCPNLASKYVNRYAITSDLTLPLETYVRALLLKPDADFELALDMEKTMLRRMQLMCPSLNLDAHQVKPLENVMYQARDRIHVREVLDSEPETRGRPLPPSRLCLNILEYEWSETECYCFRSRGTQFMCYPLASTVKEFLDTIKAQDHMHDAGARPFKVYLDKQPVNGDTWTKEDIQSLGAGSHLWRDDSSLDEEVRMDKFTIRGLILYDPDPASHPSAKKKARTDAGTEQKQCLNMLDRI